MNEHTNIETMNDKIFQADKLDSLFKKYSSKQNPCNITSFIKTTYGKKPNVVANMKVKVSRLINKTADATTNYGLLELSNDLASYFNKHHRTNGDEILGMTHFLGRQSTIENCGELDPDGSVRLYEPKNMWSIKVDAKYCKLTAVYIRSGAFAGFVRLFKKSSNFIDPNSEYRFSIVKQKKTNSIFWGFLKPLTAPRRYSVIDYSIVTGQKVGEIATNIEIAASAPFVHHFKPTNTDWLPPKGN